MKGPEQVRDLAKVELLSRYETQLRLYWKKREEIGEAKLREAELHGQSAEITDQITQIEKEFSQKFGQEELVAFKKQIKLASPNDKYPRPTQ